MDFTLGRPDESRTAARRAGIALLLLLLLLLLAMIGLSVAYDGRVLPGVRVAGVPVGGLSPEAARERLAQQAGAIAAVRAELRADDTVWQPTLAELGLALEPGQATQDAYAVGRLGGPLGRLLVIARAPFESVDVTPAAVARPRVAAWVDGAAGRFDRPAADARFEIVPTGEVRLTPEQSGRRLDRAAAIDRLVAALDGWLVALPSGGQPALALTLPSQVVAPAVTAADLAPAQREAERVLGRPAALRLDEFQRTLDRPALAALLTVKREGKLARLDVEQGRLSALIGEVAAQTDRAPVDARLSIRPDGTLDSGSDTLGRRLNQASAAEQLRAAILGSRPVELSLPAEQIPARVRAADLAQARGTAERLLAGPTEVTVGEHTFSYQPREIAPLLSVQGGALAIDRKQVEAGVGTIVKQSERAPRNARLRIVGDRLEPIEEGVDGQRVDSAAAVDMIAAALAKGERQIALLVQTTPAIKSSDRAAFGPLEVIEQSSTTYAGSIPERAHNVELAVSRLNGTVVAPGQTFSLNETLGPQTTASGFRWAWGIAGGAGGATTVPSVGGGICQVATTLFHSVFWGGYQIEERNWHLYWIPRYGAPPLGLQGLDATVDYDSGTDLKWINNTDSPILIQSWTAGQQVYFALRGKKPGWKVDVSKPQISGVVPALGGTWTETTPSMPRGSSLWVEEARQGFTSRIVRTVTAPGAEPRVLDMTSSYQPSRNIIMLGTG